MQNTQEKTNLQKTKVNTTKITKVHVDRNELHTGKEWQLLGVDQLLWSDKQADR